MKVLIVEDDEVDFLYIERSIRRGVPKTDLFFKHIKNPTKSEFLSEIDLYDICFVDYSLGHISGIDLINSIAGTSISTPIVMMTGNDDPNLYRFAILAGAADFLHKDEWTEHSISSTMKHCVARRCHEMNLIELAYVDQLTKLSNRAAFDKRCDAVASIGTDGGSQYAFVTIDLDGFKEINDSYGHPEGDEVLRKFSSKLSSLFGTAEIVARLGGDEFGVIIELARHVDQIHDIRTNLRDSLKSEFLISDTIVTVDFSVGIFVYDPKEETLTATEILKRADKDLYLDKRLGRLGAEQSSGLTAEIAKDLRITIADLTKAVTNGELEVVYQPKVNYRTKLITGLEALLRWNSPSHNLGPDQFIPLAEENNLIRSIGDWVLRQCCQDLSTWRDEGQLLLPVAINISPKQLEDCHFSREFKATLDEFEIDARMIELELTEGAFNRKPDVYLGEMNYLADLGCKWSIDDFGIGYSSLSRLGNLPISKLKIDKSFIDVLPNCRSALKVSNAIISLARKLEMTIVAEGVENLEQVSQLDLGAEDELQGYACYRPSSFTEMTEILNPAIEMPLVS